MEIETAKLHGGWVVWEPLPLVRKAQLLAHELHKKMREHYEYDLRLPAEKKLVPKNNFLNRMRDRFLGGGENKYA